MKKFIVLAIVFLSMNTLVYAFTQKEALYYLQRSDIPADSEGALMNAINQCDTGTAKLLIDGKQIN